MIGVSRQPGCDTPTMHDEHGVEADIEHYGNGRVKFSGFRIGDDMHRAWTWHRMDGSLMRTGQFE